MEREQLHAALLEEISGCQRCRLCEGRTHVVPGEGNLWARLMIIGEGPGANEDAQGRPFVGRAGQLLDEMIECIGLQREEVYICNVVKCRPPQNRAPKDDEAQACMPYLERQIELVQPEVILLMGATALNQYVSRDLRITRTRGQWLEKDGRPVLATFHPAALLRDASKKPDSFMDMLAIKRKLDGKC